MPGSEQTNPKETPVCEPGFLFAMSWSTLVIQPNELRRERTY